MKVLVADNFEKSGLDGLRAAGCEVVYQPDAKDAALVEAVRTSGADVLVVRSTKVTAAMLDAGRLSLIVRAGAGLQHDRRGRGIDARHLRLQLSGQERDRGRRAHLRLDAGARSPHSRQRGRAARRQVEQEGVRESERAARADARRAGPRQHRAGSDQARRGLWSRRRRLEPALRRRSAADDRAGSARARPRRRGANRAHRARRDARRRGGARGHPEHPPRVRRGHEGPRQSRRASPG